MRRSIVTLVALACVVTACSSNSVDAPAAEKIVCVWEKANCLPGLCAGCTAGPYGACPPAGSAFSPTCSEDTVEACRARDLKPFRLSERGALIYTRNLRVLRGVNTCAAFEAGKNASSTETLCDGECT